MDCYVSADVWSREGELWLCAVPELGADRVDSIFNTGNRVGVDVVQPRVCGIGASGRTSTWARSVNAAIRVDCCWWAIRGA